MEDGRTLSRHNDGFTTLSCGERRPLNLSFLGRSHPICRVVKHQSSPKSIRCGRIRTSLRQFRVVWPAPPNQPSGQRTNPINKRPNSCLDQTHHHTRHLQPIDHCSLSLPNNKIRPVMCISIAYSCYSLRQRTISIKTTWTKE